MVSYKQLGLVNTREMFKKAMAGKYAIPAYNFNNMEQLQAIIQGCINSRSPVILQVSKGARKYANQVLLQYMAQGAMEMIKASGVPVPVALHLDHGDSYELCVSCIESGFSSVMIDGSAHPYEKNVELTKKVVDYAHAHDVTVEGELGVLAGIEDEVHAETSHYTNPDDVEDFVKKTGVDSLAISIGTSHGAFKFKVKPGEPLPTLRFDILEEVERRIPGFPIVLHGASSVRQGIRGHDQQVRREDGRRGGDPRGPAAQGSVLGGVQDQHRLGRPAGHHRNDPQGRSRKTPRDSTPATTWAPRGKSSRSSSNGRTRTSWAAPAKSDSRRRALWGGV